MKKYTPFIWSFISAVCVLLFTTRSSVLFACNNWDDANSYFTMGKGMMNGLVIYRDLYDQKGPFLYLLYGIAYLISNKSFQGVFIIEIIAASFFLYFTGKYIEKKSSMNMSIILVPIVGAAAYSSWSFYWGGAAEEFCLPLLALSLLYLDELLCEEISEKRCQWIFAVSGVIAGIIAQIKYTMLGFFFAWLIIAVIWMWKKRGFDTSARMAVRFVIFAMIPSIPWLIYFLCTNSLDDWFRCYIYNNIFFYSQATDEGFSFLTKLYEITKTLYWLMQDSIYYFIWIILGIILQMIMEKGFLRKIALAFIFACTYFVIFIGGNKLAYYSIPLMVLAIPGAAYFGKLICKLLKDRAKIGTGGVFSTIAVLVLASSTFFAAMNTMNAEYRKYSADNVWLFEAAKQLSETDTLLEVNSIDPGLYTLTGIKPTCEYFQTNGIGLEVMFDEQKKYIKEGRTEFVLATGYEPEFIYLHYDLVDTYEYNEPEHEEVYYLFRKRH